MLDGSNNDSRKFWQKPDTLWPVFLLLLMAYALYFQTFGHGWTLDDQPVILENTDIRSLKGLLEDTYKGRPLREITFWIDYSLFGLNSGPWHVQQIFWHGLNGALLWFLIRALGASRIAAWIGAVLFVVHPLQVEVVANISNRKDSLALAFSLMAVLAYVKFLKTDRRYAWLGASLALYVVAFYAKQNAVLLPLAFLAYEYGFMPPEKRFLLKKPRPLKIAAAILATGGAGAFLMLDGISHHRARIEPFLVEMNLSPPFTETVYFQMVLKGWSFMAKRMVWPVDLAPEYVYSAPSSWLDPWVMASAAFAVVLLAALVWNRHISPTVSFALVWFLIFFLPISNIWPLNYFAADRYYYAPVSAICILAAVGFQYFYRCCGRFSLIVPAVVALVLALTTVRQAQIWQSHETLWRHALKVNPESAVVLNHMGKIATNRGDIQEARKWYMRATKVNSSRPMSRYLLGVTYEKLGNPGMALYYYRQFLERVPYSNDPDHYRDAVKLKKHLRSQYGVTF